MTPLVDVVMVILIFLMLAGSFGGTVHYLVSKQPISGNVHGQPLKPGEVPDVNLDIHVDAARDGVGFIAQGTGLAATSDPETLQKVLAGRRQQFNEAGTPTNQISVLLHPGRRVAYQDLIAVYQAALQAKFEKITFVTSR
jgi:biopolymer transport protein ExbD